jgi:adenylyltransferase/sulfurtransferase
VRYLRHILLPEIGGQGQKRLGEASVLVVGAGGLGAPILSYLTAAGVGRIGICDGDRVESSNLNRQVLFGEADLGKPKVEVAAAALRSQNNAVKLDLHATFLDDSNAPRLIADYDLVVEGLDRYAARFVLNAACFRLRKPLFSSAIGRFDGQVAAYTPGCGDSACYACLVPEAPHNEAQCEEDGVFGPVPGLVGIIAATEVLKWIVGYGDSLIGHVLIYRGQDGSVRRVRLPRDPECRICGDAH